MEAFEKALLRSEREATIAKYESEVVGVHSKTPLGIVELAEAPGFGTRWLVITLLGEDRVAIPIECDGTLARVSSSPFKVLGAAPIAYGKWYSFSIFEEQEFEEGKGPKPIRKDDHGWALKCVAQDGSAQWAPIPKNWQDQGDMEY